MLRISSFLIAIFLFTTQYAQTNDSTSRKKASFGFNLGLNQSALFNSYDSSDIQIQNAPGFRLGVTASFPISKRWSVDPKMELSFNYGKITESNTTYRVDPNNLDFMTHFKYNMKGYDGKAKPFLYFGPNVRVPLNGEFNGVTYETQTSLAIDFAFGVDIDLKHFLLSPELRFSGGVTDIRENPSGKMLRGSNAALVLCFSGK